MPDPIRIPFTAIDISNRARDKNKYGDVTPLAESIASVGTIHPIVLSHRPDGLYDLVAGGRRHRALAHNKTEFLYENSTLDPERPGFVWKENVPEHIRKEAELDENLHRLGMDWIDSVLLIDDIHRAKKNVNIKWGSRQTAALLGKGYGKSNVQYAIVLAKLLRANDKVILKCTGLTEAINVLSKRQEDAALAELTKRATGGIVQVIDQNEEPESGPLSALGVLDNISTKLGPKKTFATPKTDPLKDATDQIVEKVIDVPEVPLSVMFRLGDSVKDIMPSYPDAFFNHIVTDIPYGIDMDNLTAKGKADVEDQHDVEANIDLMRPFLKQAFRLVRSGGFCVFFYDMDHHEKLMHWAEDIGWKVQRWNLTWVKTHPCKNQAPAYNYTKATEVAMVLRRDEKSVLRKPQTQNYWIGEGSSERKLYNNKFAKPSALWRELIYSAIAFSGQSVYDPFWGEGSASRAAANLGLLPYGSEINPVHYNRGVEGMKGVYALIHKSNVKFT